MIKFQHQEDKLFEIVCSSKRQVMNHQKLIGFDQLHKDGYQRFFDKERKDIGVNILDS